MTTIIWYAILGYASLLLFLLFVFGLSLALGPFIRWKHAKRQSERAMFEAISIESAK